MTVEARPGPLSRIYIANAPVLLREALDGRSVRWLSRRSGVSYILLTTIVSGNAPLTAWTYGRLRAALPALPESPETVKVPRD